MESLGARTEAIPGPPWYLRVLVNGEKILELKTEVAATAAGKLSFFPDLQGGEEFLDGQGRILVPSRSFARGRTSIEVLIRDFAGNERSAGWTVVVE
jgi:hypothetical protein